MLVYTENSDDGFVGDNLVLDNTTNSWSLNKESKIVTDVFDGIQLGFDLTASSDSITLDAEGSGWIEGSASIVVMTGPETQYFPWEYEIIFTGDETEYTTETARPTLVKDIEGNSLERGTALMNESYPFYAINKLSVDSLGQYEKLDIIALDINESGAFEWTDDVVIFGHTVESRGSKFWAGTVFSVDFRNIIDPENFPQANDVYRVRLNRPYSGLDQFVFTVEPSEELETKSLKTAMDSIKVVPNPYIATNIMEPAVANKFLNQRRRLLFTHIPAECTIRIFTSSGVLVDKIEVDNPPSDGMVYWDLLTREGLEIAAGMYVFQINAKNTNDKKVGKFAVIK